ncbi:MAG: preprotein translocase subunit SecE [Clostridia bacterium]|nr:preprotein translocase subunit SecE [Clostridia bacterium]
MAKKEVKTNKKENVKNKKSFAKDFKAELKRVVWPTPKQLVNNTTVVITIVLLTAAIVFVLDVVFEFANKFVVGQVEKSVTASEQKEETSSEENTTTEETTEETSTEENTTTETAE